MEACPSVVRAEVGRTVIAVSVSSIVAVVEVVCLTGEDGGHCAATEAGTDFRSTGAENRAVHLVGRKIGSLCRNVFPS